MPQFQDDAGNIWEATGPDDPRPVLVRPAGGQPSGPPADPSFQFEGQQAAATARNTTTDAQVNAATQADQVRKARADADKAEADARAAAASVARGGTTAEMSEARRSQASRLAQLSQQINRTQELFNAGPGSTSGVLGVLDYLPGDANSAFDVAGASLSQQGLAAFRVPGTGTVSDRDAVMFDRANLPTASTRDAATQEQLRGMRARVEAEYESLGLPIPQWEGAPGPSAMNQLNIGASAAPQAAGGGAQNTSVPYPPEGVAEHQQLLARLITEGGGRMDPQAYARERAVLDRRYGQEPGDDYEGWAGRVNEYFDQGGTTAPGGIKPSEQPLSGAGQVWNNVASSETGTGVANYLDSAGFGGVSLLQGEQMGAANDMNPTAALLGQIGGAITGTGALGKLGKETIGRVVPGMFGGGRAAQFGRNLAGDVAYSGVYGANTGQDPTMSMLAGGIGSVGGQVAGKVVGGALSGAARSPAAQYLASRNIPLTTGQTIGGVAGRIEERAMSLPGIGDMIRNRRIDGMDAFGEEAFRQGGEPIGFKPTAIGQEGLAQFDDAVDDAYTVLDGVNVPFDPTGLADLDATKNLSGALRSDRAAEYNRLYDLQIQPMIDRGAITGPDYQDSRRALGGLRSDPATNIPGGEQRLKELLGTTQEALTSQVQRGGAPEVVEGLNNANAANRNLETIRTAANNAAGGSVTEVPFEFSPNQLQRAGLQTQRNFPGPRPFAELADAGAEVLPNRLANSQSADRLMQAGALGGLTAVGGAGGYVVGGDAQGATTGAAIPTLATLLAMLGGTKTGQKLITGALTRRPDQMRRLGTGISRRSGMFGSAAIPLALPSN